MHQESVYTQNEYPHPSLASAMELGCATNNLLLLDYCAQLIEYRGEKTPDYVSAKRQELNDVNAEGKTLRWLDIPIDGDGDNKMPPDLLLRSKIARTAQQLTAIDSGEAYMCYVLVPAFNEEAYIGSLINSLKGQQTTSPLAVIVADNNSNDGTVRRVRQLECNVISAPKQGVGPARQRAIDCALAHARQYKLSLFVQTDADCVADPRYIHSVVAAFSAHPDMQIGIGPSIYSIPCEDGSTVVLDSGRQYGEFLGTKGLRSYFEAFGRDVGDYLLKPPFRYLVGPNTAFRASVFTDTALRYPDDGRWETLDFSIRFQQRYASDRTIQYVDGQRMQVSPRAILGNAPYLTADRLKVIRTAGYVAMFRQEGTDETPFETAARIIQEIDAATYNLAKDEILIAITEEGSTPPKNTRTIQALHAATRVPLLGKMAVIGKR
jgi:glycosyltransferase involved in cell wall biosynthesis